MTSKEVPTVRGNKSGEPRISPAQADLGGHLVPLTREGEQVIFGIGLGNETLRKKVGLRNRLQAERENWAKRYSPAQRAIDRQGARKVLDAIRTARGTAEPQATVVTEKKPPLSEADKTFLSYEQGGELSVRPKPLPANPDQPTLLDTLPKPFGPPVEFIKISEGPSVDLEDRAIALDALFKALGRYNAVGHVEEKLAKDDSVDGEEMGRKVDGMKASADRAMQEAWPHVDTLTAADYYRRKGYNPKEIAKHRHDRIKQLKEYGAKTNSEQRRTRLKRAQATAAMAASIKSRK